MKQLGDRRDVHGLTPVVLSPDRDGRRCGSVVLAVVLDQRVGDQRVAVVVVTHRSTSLLVASSRPSVAPIPRSRGRSCAQVPRLAWVRRQQPSNPGDP
jgi:hypothetical protein